MFSVLFFAATAVAVPVADILETVEAHPQVLVAVVGDAAKAEVEAACETAGLACRIHSVPDTSETTRAALQRLASRRAPGCVLLVDEPASRSGVVIGTCGSVEPPVVSNPAAAAPVSEAPAQKGLGLEVAVRADASRLFSGRLRWQGAGGVSLSVEGWRQPDALVSARTESDIGFSALPLPFLFDNTYTFLRGGGVNLQVGYAGAAGKRRRSTGLVSAGVDVAHTTTAVVRTRLLNPSNESTTGTNVGGVVTAEYLAAVGPVLFISGVALKNLGPVHGARPRPHIGLAVGF